MNFINVWNSIVNTGGATYQVHTGILNPISGWTVAMKGFEKKIPVPKSLNEFQKIVQEYLTNDVWFHLNEPLYRWLGYWIEGDCLVMDIILIFDDRDHAIDFAYKNNQRAIYNLETKTVHKLSLVSNDPDIETDKKY